MTRLVPIDQLPPEIAEGIKPGTSAFKAYAALLEREHKLLPGSLADASWDSKQANALWLVAAAQDLRAKNLEYKHAEATESDRVRADPSKGAGTLQFGPWDTGMRIPEGAQQFLAATGKSFADTGEGIGQLNRSVSQEEVDERARRDGPLLDTGWGKAGYVTGVLGQSLLPAAAVARAAASVPVLSNSYVMQSLLGAGHAGMQPVETGSDRTGQMAMGALSSLSGQGIGHAGVAAVRPAYETLKPSVAKLARKALEKYQIPFRATDINPAPVNVALQSILDSVPGSGGHAAYEAAQSGYNAALAKTLGESGDDISAALMSSRARNHATYEALAARNIAQVDPNKHGDALIKAFKKFARTDTSSNKSVSQSLNQYLGDLVSQHGKWNPVSSTWDIPGDAYKALRSEARKLATSAAGRNEGTLADFYTAVKEQLDDAMRNSTLLTRGDAALYKKADREWGNMRTLENIAPRDASGTADFKSLARTMHGKGVGNVYNRNAAIYGNPTGNDLVDLGKAGVQFGGRGPSPTNWDSLSGVAKGTAKAAVLPAAIGGLYYRNMQEHDGDPYWETLKDVGALGLTGLAAGRASNSRWFAKGAPKWIRDAFRSGEVAAPHALRGYVLGDMRSAEPALSTLTEALGGEPHGAVPLDMLPDDLRGGK